MLTVEDVRTRIDEGRYDYKYLPKQQFSSDEKRTKLTPLEEFAWKNACIEANKSNPCFYDDVLEAFDITNHPMASKIYGLAYEDGHSAGYGEVLNHMYDLVELITKPEPVIKIQYQAKCSNCGWISSPTYFIERVITVHSSKRNTNCKAPVTIRKITLLEYVYDEELKS